MKTQQTNISLGWHLRVALLPQCNLRCRYCNPNGLYQKANILDNEEIIEIVKASVANGIVRVHWTGGEPCLKDLVPLFFQARDAGMIKQIMTTNGTLKIGQIFKMKTAGLDRVNISLDTLDSQKYKKITGLDLLHNVIKWIETCCNNFDMISKMNIVPMKDNINEIPDFIKFAQRFNGKLLLKFIELCPNNPAFYNDEIQDYYVSRQEIINKLETIGKLELSNDVGDNPNAEYYWVGNTKVKIILVTMPSQDFKCGLANCRKMRISPYGLVGSCIQQKGIQLIGQTLNQKIAIIKERMEVRCNYSDGLTVRRKHKRTDYGIWRFGQIKECM